MWNALEQTISNPSYMYQTYTIIMAICVTITTVAAAVAVIVKAWQLMKKPEKTQNDRIEALEKKVDRFEQLFDNDNKRLIELEKGNRVYLQALLALISHALNGNDVDGLKQVKSKIENYLIGTEGD